MSDLRERMPPVERLSERSRARIERGVFEAIEREPVAMEDAVAPLRRARTGWFVLAGVSVVAAAAIIIIMPRTAIAPRAAAPVRVSADDGPRTVIHDGATIELQQGAAVVASADVVVLERGSARFAVEKRGARPAFVVQAGEVRVEVVGTKFEVAREDDHARVSVSEGTVRVITAGTVTLVHAGESWPATASTDTDAAPVAAPVAAPAAAPVAAPAAAPVAAADAVPVPAPAPPHHRTKSSPPAAAPADVPDARTQYERAASMEARDSAAALALYDKVAAGDGVWAAYALFAAARLELDLGHTAAGKERLAAYLRRFPDGANADDARMLFG